MKPYYSEFVRHCLRYYIKTIDEGKGGCPVFRNEAERENWRACNNVLKHYTPENQDAISEIYRQGDTIPDKIYQLAKIKGTSQDHFWSLINITERKIAKERGLI